MGQNSIISNFFARRAKKASAEGQSPPQELEVSPRSGLYLLVATYRLNRPSGLFSLKATAVQLVFNPLIQFVSQVERYS